MDGSRQRGWRMAALTVLALIGLSVSACGGSGGEETAAVGEDGPPAVVSADAEDGSGAEPEAGEEAPEPPEGTSGQSAPEGLAWVPFGPSDPDNPTPSWPIYKAFAAGDCGALHAELSQVDIGDFGRALSAVCAAAVDGAHEQWSVAAAHAGADASGLANDCLAPVLSDMIDRAVAWHTQHPTETPDVQFIGVEGQTECAATTGPDSVDGGEETEPPVPEPPEEAPPSEEPQAPEPETSAVPDVHAPVA